MNKFCPGDKLDLTVTVLFSHLSIEFSIQKSSFVVGESLLTFYLYLFNTSPFFKEIKCLFCFFLPSACSTWPSSVDCDFIFLCLLFAGTKTFGPRAGQPVRCLRQQWPAGGGGGADTGVLYCLLTTLGGALPSIRAATLRRRGEQRREAGNSEEMNYFLKQRKKNQ